MMYEPSSYASMDPNFPYSRQQPAPAPMQRPVPDHGARNIPRGSPAPYNYNRPPPEADYHRPNQHPSHNSYSASNSIFPRSASEALFDTTTKFRQLPCRTFISVGTCPYRERCVYLHDPRCICKEAKTKTRRKNKEDVVLDSLFWPVMPYPMVAAKLDMNRQPHVIQSYSVPTPQHDQYHRHDTAVFSLWMHFVDFCMANADANTARNADAATCYCAPDAAINGYTEEPRLHIFRYLSACNGRNVSREEFANATSAVIPPYARSVMIPRTHIPVATVDGYGGSPSPSAYDASRGGLYPSSSSQYADPNGYCHKELEERTRRTSSHASSLSSSPITVASDRSPQRYVPSQRSAVSAPYLDPVVPTSLSLLMNSVPQNTVHGVDAGSKLDLQSVPMDPWGLDGFGGNTDDERDSGSSFNSVPMQHDFHSIWKNESGSFHSNSSFRDSFVHDVRNSSRL